MRVVGLDLAGSPKNPSGYCDLKVSDRKLVLTSILHSDEEILYEIEEGKPDLVAVDAPLSFDGERRLCDAKLSPYGALPATLKGMRVLAERGCLLASELGKKGFSYIEVHSLSSAKILGVYSGKDFTMQKNMMGLDIEGDINTKILQRDELDAVSCALTGYLHLIGQTKLVGDEKSYIVVPEI